MTFAPAPADAPTVYVVTVYDGADFERVLDRRAFSTWAEADRNGAWRVAQLRGQRRAEGETDPAFVDAIRHDIIAHALDAAWAPAKPAPNPLRPRALAAHHLTMAQGQLARLLRRDSFALAQHRRDPGAYLEGIRHHLRLARSCRRASADLA